jgi:hypothetical protein
MRVGTAILRKKDGAYYIGIIGGTETGEGVPETEIVFSTLSLEEAEMLSVCLDYLVASARAREEESTRRPEGTALN